ncbi:MAG: ASKHA domain-containing protein [Candidatus Hodarchaeales archaeon]|jgi:uncharacterized 2Fe-2S/4Fe-4S cluster protein (DUF4445 family)
MPQQHNGDLKVRFEPDGIATRVGRGKLIFQTAKDAGVGLRSECGGKGTCGKCLVQAMPPNILSIPKKSELDRLGSENAQKGLRLACQAQLWSTGVIEIIPAAQTRPRKLQLEGKSSSYPLDPSYVKVHIEVDDPTLEDQRSDIQRIAATVQDSLKLDDVKFNSTLSRTSPEIFREANWKLMVTVWNGQEIIEILPQSVSEEVLGIAVDLGTSKIAIHLLDLVSGKTIGMHAIENPQLPYGEDVISRMQFAQETPKNQAILKDKVVGSINSVIGQLARQSNHDLRDIYSLMVVGNTPQLHFFAGADSRYLARSPFVPLFSDSITLDSSFSGIHINPTGTVTLFPSVGGFVGGDCVAVVLSTGINDADELSLAIDVGTNTEIVLGNRTQLQAVSCASGPAFEGIHIQHGMKAVEGAIEHVRICPETFAVDLEVIGDVAPIGLCGSAMIDCIAELLKAGFLKTNGQLSAPVKSDSLVGEGRKRQFILASADESGIDSPIVITQEDIRNLQLAKAAILTGCFTLFRLAKEDTTNIKHVYLAGAFGNQVNPANATIMGLLPDFPPEILEFEGNAAIEGAKRALLSKSELEQARRIARKIKHYELAKDEQFQREYTNSLFFPHRDPTRFSSAKQF